MKLCPDCMTESIPLKDIGVGDPDGRALYLRVDEPGPNTVRVTVDRVEGRRTVEREQHWLYVDLYCPVCDECYPSHRALLGHVKPHGKMAAAGDA